MKFSFQNKSARLLVLPCCLVFCFFSCKSSKQSGSKRLPGFWQVSPIVIDGKNNDWPSPYPDYDEKALLGYSVTNDKENLYISAETGDLATQLKILKNGLTVWIDKTGGKDEITAINFPVPDEFKSLKPEKGDGIKLRPDDRADQKRLDLEDRINAALHTVNEFSLQGFKGCNQQFSLLERDSCGIVTRIAIDSNNELVWEAVVPLKSFYNKAEITRVDKGRPMSVCFETEGLPRPANSGQRSGQGGGGGGFRPSVGVGGFGGMGMRMGGSPMHNRGSSGSRQPDNNLTEPLYRSTKTRKVFGLAWKE